MSTLLLYASMIDLTEPNDSENDSQGKQKSATEEDLHRSHHDRYVCLLFHYRSLSGFFQ